MSDCWELVTGKFWEDGFAQYGDVIIHYVEHDWYGVLPWLIHVWVPWGDESKWLGIDNEIYIADESGENNVTVSYSEREGHDWVKLNVKRCKPSEPIPEGCWRIKGVSLSLGDDIMVGDIHLKAVEYHKAALNPWEIVVTAPWGITTLFIGGAGGKYFGDAADENYVILDDAVYYKEEFIEFTVLRCAPFDPIKIQVGYSRRWGHQMYLSGKVSGIKTSDELCIKFARPDDGEIFNLESDTRGYQYLKGTSGSFSFHGNNCYLPYWTQHIVPADIGPPFIPAHYEDEFLPGIYRIIVYDVSGTCENVGKVRATASVPLMETRHQYQLVFDVGALEFPALTNQLEYVLKEAKRFEAWSFIASPQRDCYYVKAKYPSGWGTEYLAWLCSASEQRWPVACKGIPGWICPHPSEKIGYFRGECSCAMFGEFAQFGIPCIHLAALMTSHGNSPPRCPYKPCP